MNDTKHLRALTRRKGTKKQTMRQWHYLKRKCAHDRGSEGVSFP